MEDEYFVQLFVEHDESLKLLTTGDLLKRMFEDQNITFTKVHVPAPCMRLSIPANNMTSILLLLHNINLGAF